MAKLRQLQVEQPTTNNPYPYAINNTAMLDHAETLDVSDNEDDLELETESDLKTIPYNIDGKPISILKYRDNGFTEREFITEYRQARDPIAICVAGTVPKAGEKQIIAKPSYPSSETDGISGKYTNYCCTIMKVNDQKILIRDSMAAKENFREIDLSMLENEYNYRPADNKIGKFGLLLTSCGGDGGSDTYGDEVKIPGYKESIHLPGGGGGGGGTLWGIIDFRKLKDKDILLISFTYAAIYLFYISGANTLFYDWLSTPGLTHSPFYLRLQTAYFEITNPTQYQYSAAWDSACKPMGQGGSGHGSCFDHAKFNVSPNDTLWHTTVDQGQNYEMLGFSSSLDSLKIKTLGYWTRLPDKRLDYGCIAYIKNGKTGGRGRSNGETEGGKGASEYWISDSQNIFTYVGYHAGGKGAGYIYDAKNTQSVASDDLNYSIEFFNFKSEFGKHKYSTIISHPGKDSSMDINNQRYFIPGGNSFGPAPGSTGMEKDWGCGGASSSTDHSEGGPGYWALYY